MVWLGATVAFVIVATTIVDGICVIKQCGKSSLCVGEDQPQKLGNTANDRKVKEYCPYWSDDAGDFGDVCCTGDMFFSFRKSLSRLEMIKHCPACYYNIINFFCHLHCSPNQNEFVRLTTVNETSDRIEKVDVWLADESARQVYDSCSNVGLVGQKVPQFLGSLLGVPNITYKLFYEKVLASQFSKIQPHIASGTENGIVPAQPQTRRCNDTVHNVDDGGSCDCRDCPASCSATTSTTAASQTPSPVTTVRPKIGKSGGCNRNSSLSLLYISIIFVLLFIF